MTSGVCTACSIAQAFCADKLSLGSPWPCHVSCSDSLTRNEAGLNPGTDNWLQVRDSIQRCSKYSKKISQPGHSPYTTLEKDLLDARKVKPYSSGTESSRAGWRHMLQCSLSCG